MKASDIKKVFVAGGGLMGRQIALDAALNGYTVALFDSMPGVGENVSSWAREYLDGRVAKGKMEKAVADAAFDKLTTYDTMEEGAKDCDLVIEAIVEKMDVKEEFFKKLDKLVRSDTIITTNSSFMVSSMFVDFVSNPSRLANLHYFNPALVMRLVEIVQGPHTSDETAQALSGFVDSLENKVAVVLKKELDGFLVNRVQRAITDTALEIVELGVSTPQEVDIAVENGLNHPMGPFRLMDLIGIDLNYFMRDEAYQKTGEKPIGFDLLKEKYDKGEFGRKSGKGWYDYSKK